MIKQHKNSIPCPQGMSKKSRCRNAKMTKGTCTEEKMERQFVQLQLKRPNCNPEVDGNRVLTAKRDSNHRPRFVRVKNQEKSTPEARNGEKNTGKSSDKPGFGSFRRKIVKTSLYWQRMKGRKQQYNQNLIPGINENQKSRTATTYDREIERRTWVKTQLIN